MQVTTDTVNTSYDYVNSQAGQSLTHLAGMARIMTCTRGVAILLNGGRWEDTGLPECFQPTPERTTKSAFWGAGGMDRDLGLWP